MLDIKFIRENKAIVKKSLRDRNLELNIDEVIEYDNTRRQILSELEELRAQKNKANDEISRLLKEKKDPKEKISSMKAISAKIDKLEEDLKGQEIKLNQLLLIIPNVPHPSVPVGDPSQAKIVRTWGSPKKLDFPALTHTELSQHLDIIDFSPQKSAALILCFTKDGGQNLNAH